MQTVRKFAILITSAVLTVYFGSLKANSPPDCVHPNCGACGVALKYNFRIIPHREMCLLLPHFQGFRSVRLMVLADTK